MSKSVPVNVQMPPPRWNPIPAMAAKIALSYGVLGGLWILCSGWLLHHFVRDSDLEALLETFKGWFFVSVTAGLLWLALARYFREIRRSAQMLNESEERLRLALDAAQMGIFDWDLVHNHITWSRWHEQLWGYQPGEFDGTYEAFSRRVHSEDRAEMQRDLDRSLANQSPFRHEFRVVWSDGSVHWIVSVGECAFGADGRPSRMRGAVREITGRKELETQLRQAQKLEAVGQLAGGVAHDFNNILAAIMMHLGLLQMNSRLDEETRHALGELDAQARQAAGLTRQLLMFSRRSVLAVKPLDLNAVVVNLLKMLRRLIGEQIDLRFDGKSALPMVEADDGMMEQVLMNLAVNARDAMPKGGRLTIGTTVADVGVGHVVANPNRRAGSFVCLVVSDTGCGMNAATLKRIFEPFFTTKEPGKGTGLGLATVHGIVAQHKGWVEVESEMGKGTTFRVYLPAAAQMQVETAPIPASEPVRRGKETVLLVEDELPVRQVVGRSLRALGYQVHEAENGQEAMRLWQTHGAQVDLLLTDMVMPEGMTGLELAEQLQALKPGLKAIISSGYSAEMVEVGVPTKEGIVYLPKPYTTSVLANVVRDCLDQKK
jgi:two-component system, cell cycle sensor histidine kinase and response regulator CckA